MIVKISCACNASFEVRPGARHPKTINCPNCGRPLPENASSDLLSALEFFETFDTKNNVLRATDIIFENENNEKFEIMTPEGFNANENQEANMISRSQKNIDEKRSGINNEVFVNKKSAHSILDDSLKNGLDKQTTNKQKESISKT